MENAREKNIIIPEVKVKIVTTFNLVHKVIETIKKDRETFNL